MSTAPTLDQIPLKGILKRTALHKALGLLPKHFSAT